MIHGESEGEGGISRFNGTRHVFAHLDELPKASKFKTSRNSCPWLQTEGEGGRRKGSFERAVFHGRKLKRKSDVWKSAGLAPCHMKPAVCVAVF